VFSPFFLRHYLSLAHLLYPAQQIQIPVQQHINHLRVPGGASGLIWILVSEPFFSEGYQNQEYAC